MADVSTDMFPDSFIEYMLEDRRKQEQGVRDGYHDAAMFFGGPLVETIKEAEGEEAFMPAEDAARLREEGFTH